MRIDEHNNQNGIQAIKSNEQLLRWNSSLAVYIWISDDETVEPIHRPFVKPWNQYTGRLLNRGTSTPTGYENVEPVHRPVMKPWNQYTSRLWNRGTNTPAGY